MSVPLVKEKVPVGVTKTDDVALRDMPPGQPANQAGSGLKDVKMPKKKK